MVYVNGKWSISMSMVYVNGQCKRERQCQWLMVNCLCKWSMVNVNVIGLCKWSMSMSMLNAHCQCQFQRSMVHVKGQRTMSIVNDQWLMINGLCKW